MSVALSETDELLRREPRERLETMLEAGVEVLECYRLLNKTGANVVGQVLAHQGTFYEWNHYPEGDVYDNETHSQYYYHAHRGSAGEHGHFHTFLRAKGMPPDVEPAPYEGDQPRPTGTDAIAHIVAISMNAPGFPIGLFTTNRWVTGETFYSADDVIAMLDRFSIEHTFPCLASNIWITNMLRLFRPQIVTLLRLRDEAVAGWAARHPDRDVYEDRDLEITSRMAVSVEDQIAAIRKALG